MEKNTHIKIVYQDGTQTRILRGILIKEDDLSLTIQVESDKEVMIGKRFIIKACNIVEGDGQ